MSDDRLADVLCPHVCPYGSRSCPDDGCGAKAARAATDLRTAIRQRWLPLRELSPELADVIDAAVALRLTWPGSVARLSAAVRALPEHLRGGA